MRWFASVVVVTLAIAVVAFPITPSAPELQLLVEQMRLAGMQEHAIAKYLSTDILDFEPEYQPFLLQISAKIHSLFYTPTEEEKHDVTGDIAPGSIDPPQMLPRATVSESLVDRISQRISVIFKREEIERRKFAYEGKELEMRRPKGMRHWNS